ncbi:hypothetical protein LHFGNBLO_005532 [Mesorhizobium sp. AR10]|uniref:hypothetical protein n=1 Tax=Mesorhizobium sp. AR10 TaxID=2865839 RepID=UPI0021600F56|nr:hypothetical protein [Mesorhizobium sp. AR10]UVK38371.1 hypothetical protein LHFGNBLO_005532 [Mesorhizobium sp. AR10]
MSGDRSADDCSRSNPSDAMTRSPPTPHLQEIEHQPFCAGISTGSSVVPAALRNDELFQHNQKKTQEGND